jgi:hypothetical protein
LSLKIDLIEPPDYLLRISIKSIDIHYKIKNITIEAKFMPRAFNTALNSAIGKTAD